MGESTLEHAMQICIEGPDQLPSETLETVIDHYKHAKNAKSGSLKVTMICTQERCENNGVE